MESGLTALVLTVLVIYITFDQQVHGQSTVQGGGESTDLWKILEMLENKVQGTEEKAVSADMRIADLKRQIENSYDIPGAHGEKSSTYVRWGRTTCAGNATNLVYKGFAAGSHHVHSGNGANYVCLTEDPTYEYANIEGGAFSASIYGIEYQVDGDWPLKADNVSPGKVNYQDAPCAVCETVGRGAALMIPGTHLCPQGWSQEYTGYLMCSFQNQAPTEYICVDGSPEGLAGGGSRKETAALLYYVRTKCGALPCYRYINEREITCVVCSK